MSGQFLLVTNMSRPKVQRLYPDYVQLLTTSQNTMYCGGDPEQRHNTYILIAHKHVITKYMHVS